MTHSDASAEPSPGRLWSLRPLLPAATVEREVRERRLRAAAAETGQEPEAWKLDDHAAWLEIEHWLREGCLSGGLVAATASVDEAYARLEGAAELARTLLDRLDPHGSGDAATAERLAAVTAIADRIRATRRQMARINAALAAPAGETQRSAA